MKRTRALAIVPFAWTMIGADDCALTQIGQPVPQSSTTPTKPFCFTDPPLGCAAICSDVDVVDWTGACSNVEAGPRTAQFKMDIDNAVSSASAKGVQLCTALNIGAAVTPCMDGITPAEWPNQDHEVCTPSPLGCPL